MTRQRQYRTRQEHHTKTWQVKATEDRTVEDQTTLDKTRWPHKDTTNQGRKRQDNARQEYIPAHWTISCHLNNRTQRRRQQADEQNRRRKQVGQALQGQVQGHAYKTGRQTANQPIWQDRNRDTDENIEAGIAGCSHVVYVRVCLIINICLQS